MAYMSAREMLSGLPVKMAEGGPVTYGKYGATAQDIQNAAVRVQGQMDAGTYDPAAAYAEIMASDISVDDALDAGIDPSLIDAIFSTPTALTPDQLSSQGQTSVIGSGTDFANALTQESVDAYETKILGDDGVVTPAERLEMQKIATDQGVTFQDMIAFGVDPNMLYNTPAPVVPVVTDPTDPAALAESIAAFDNTQAGYTATPVYQPLPDNTSVYEAGTAAEIAAASGINPFGPPGETPAEAAARIAATKAVDSLDTTFRNSAPRTEVLDTSGNLAGFDYTTGADLLSATGSGFNWTPPTVTSRPRSLLSTDQVNRLNQGRAAADLRQLSFQPGQTAAQNEARYNSYAGLLDNPGSYSGGLSRSQIYARQQAEDYRRAGLPPVVDPVVDDIGQSGTVQDYLAMFPDISEGFTSQKASGGIPSDMTLNQFAREHYAKFGIDEILTGQRRKFTLLPLEAADVVPGLPGTAAPADLAEFVTPAGVADPYATNSSNWNLTDGQLAEGMFGQVELAQGGSVKKPQGFADGGTASADLGAIDYILDKAEKGVKRGADALGFDSKRQLQISADATNITNRMVEQGQLPEENRITWGMNQEDGSQQIVSADDLVNTGSREAIGFIPNADGRMANEQAFDTVNHALFGWESEESLGAKLGGQAKEVYQAIKVANLKRKREKEGASEAELDKYNWRTEYKDLWNNQWGINQRQKGLTREQFNQEVASALLETKRKVAANEPLRLGQDLIINPMSLAQGFAKGGIASSEPTAEELTAQLIAMDAQAAPAEQPLDQEQTESRNILDRLTATPFTKEGERSIFGSALAGIPGAVESAIGYGKDVVTAPSPSAKLLADIFVTGGEMKQSAGEDPLGYLGETLPPFAQVNALNQVDELNKQVNEARRNGNEEEAKRLEKFITVTALGAFPFIKGGVRPRVTPGQGPLKITGPETTSKNMLDELSGKSVTDPLALEAPVPRPEAPTPTVAPEVGEALKMLDEVDAVPAPKSNLTKTETATLNKSAGRNGGLRASANLAGENFKLSYPVDGGWAPVEITGVKFKNGNAKVTTKKIPYAFQKPPEGVTAEEWSKQLSAGVVSDVENIIQRAKSGDQAAVDILAQAAWYRAMRVKLREEFGGMGDVFADVIGATSAQTNVEQNYNNSVDIMRKYSRGEYDLELEAYQRRVDQGLPVDGKTLIRMHKAGEFPLITKDSGALFNTNSPSAMGALLDMFRTIKAGKSPKTPNFTGNLIGLTDQATIDVWAARKLRDLAGLPRIPPSAEQAVTGTHRVGSTLENPNVGAEFGFGQGVFREAAAELNKGGALKEFSPDIGDLGPDDLQAVVWFIEKEQWAKNGWTTKSGEGGSLDYEMSLAGSQSPERVAELRREVNAGFKQPKQRKKDTDSAYDLRVMDARTAFEQTRRAAQDELASLAAPLSRIQLGVAGERPNQPMSGYAQAELAAEFDDVVRDDPSVLTYNLANTYGSFMGDTERALNAEFIVRDNFDVQPLRTRLIEQGKAYDQDAVFLSRVVPESTPNARPGVEIYFRETITPEQMAVVTERLREKGVDGFTYVTDMRFNDRINRQTRSGDPETAGLTGLRFQYVPEFDDSFDPQNAIESYNKAEDLFRSVLNDTVGDGNVSDARITYYDTEVYFRDDYDEQLSRTVKKGNNGTGGKIPSGANDPQADSGKQFGTELSGDVPDGIVQKASAQEITALNKSGDPLGINVAVDKNGTDYADLIVNGTKKFESRETPSLKPYVGKRVGIVRTGAGPAEVIGSVEIGQPIEVNQRDFNKLRDQHLVAEDSSFNIKKGQTKFLYPMIDPTTTAPQKVTSKGIVARAVPVASPPQLALPKVDPSLPKYEGMRDATVQRLKDKGIMSDEEFRVAELGGYAKDPKFTYSIDDSGSNSSYITLKKTTEYDDEYGVLDFDEYTIRFSDHSLPKQYGYDQNIYNVSEDYYDETINGKTLNDAINYVDRLLPNTPAAQQDDINTLLNISDDERKLWRKTKKETLNRPDGWTREPNKDLILAAQNLGKIQPTTSKAMMEYAQEVQRISPIKLITQVPELVSFEDIANTLDEKLHKKGIIGVNRAIEEGENVGARLHIPGYNAFDTWIVTVHEGTGKSGPVLGYGQLAVLDNVTFNSSPEAAYGIAATNKGKSTFARMNGKWRNVDPEVTVEEAKTYLKESLEADTNWNQVGTEIPNWIQVGMNPDKHSYFYNKSTGQPLGSANKILQIGQLVLARGAVTRDLLADEHKLLTKKAEKGVKPTHFKKGGAIEPVYNNDRRYI